MLKAKKNPLAIKMFQLVERRLLKQTFGKIYLKNDYENILPAFYIANHSAWWDGLLLFELERQNVIPNFYVMTDIQGMKRVPIFQWIGAYSVDATSPKHVMNSLRYSEALLQQGNNICLFPQGMERHLEERPLQFQHGAAMLAGRIEAPIVPMTFYYTFRNSKKAEAWIWIGSPILYEKNTKRTELTTYFEQVVTEQLDQLKQAVIHNDTALFTTIL